MIVYKIVLKSAVNAIYFVEAANKFDALVKVRLSIIDCNPFEIRIEKHFDFDKLIK